MENKTVDHDNIFESYRERDIFIMGIIEKVVHDWTCTSTKMETLNRKNLNDFFLEQFQEWVEIGVWKWCNAEWGEEE